MKAYLYLANGFEEIEAVGTVDILRRAGIEVETVSIMDKREVTGARKVKVVADMLFEQAQYADVDILILPGGGPGTKLLGAHEGLKTKLRSFYEQGGWIAAICAAPTVFGKLGLLEGKSAVCYPGMEDELLCADTPDEKVVVDGKIITSKGPGTCFEFAFKIVEVLIGKEVVSKLKSDMVIG